MKFYSKGPGVAFRLVWIVLVGIAAHVSFAQEGKDEVAATVGDDKIFVSQIEHEFQRKFAERNVSGELAAGLRSQILQRLVKQQLVLVKLSGSDIISTDDEVNLEISRLSERLKQIEKTLEEYLEENGQSLAGLRFNYRWQISWSRYLDRTLTDKVLENYFERHRRQFDGTRLKVAHILWKVSDEDSLSAESVTEVAGKIRQQITDGTISWKDAAASNSTAPSADNSGDIGWIDFDGPMPRDFTTTAFELELDQISQPVQTPFGIHLIKCLDVQRGTIPWYEASDEIRRVATEDLFERIAKKQIETTEVRVSKPGRDAADSKPNDKN